MTDEGEKLQWHPAFYAAVELTLKDDADILDFTREENLNQKPLQVDLVVVKKNSERQVKASIGRIFRKRNLFEYKSPGDELGIDTWYKAVAYACLYKVEKATEENGIPADDITLTLVREGKPETLFAYLESMGAQSGLSTRIVEKSPGVYWCANAPMFTTQILVTRELSDEENVWLKSLTRNLQPEDADRLVAEASAFPPDSRLRRLADAVMQVAAGANKETFEKLLKEDPEMYDVLVDLVKDDPRLQERMKNDLDKAREEALARGREEGWNQGREEGVTTVKRQSAERTIRDTDLDDATIARILDMPVDDIKTLREQTLREQAPQVQTH